MMKERRQAWRRGEQTQEWRGLVILSRGGEKAERRGWMGDSWGEREAGVLADPKPSRAWSWR